MTFEPMRPFKNPIGCGLFYSSKTYFVFCDVVVSLMVALFRKNRNHIMNYLLNYNIKYTVKPLAKQIKFANYLSYAHRPVMYVYLGGLAFMVVLPKNWEFLPFFMSTLLIIQPHLKSFNDFISTYR